MMKIVIISFWLCLLCLSNVTGQQVGEADIFSRRKAESVVNKHLGNKADKHCHLVFSVSDSWYLIIIEKEGSFEEYYIKADTLKSSRLVKTSTVAKSNELLKKAFNPNLYYKGYVTFDSDFYKSGYEMSEGNITYFYFKDKKGNKYGESRLSVFIKPNPIDDQIYNYLRLKLLNYITG